MAILKNKENEELELGFGSKVYKDRVRFLNRDGTVNVRRTGLGGFNNVDIYNWLIAASFPRLLSVIIGSYILINLVFASIYYAVGAEHFGGLEYDSNSELQKFLGLFFFSAQTITTLGYGHVYPIGNMAGIAAAAESLLGLLSFAVATGVLYGRFSRPSAHILYSNNLIIAPYKGMTALMFRIANKKQYELIETEAALTLALTNPETNKREFINLNLEISRINFMTLSWTIVHALDENSPLFGLSLKDMAERDVELIVLIKGINDTYSQTVYSRCSYKAEDMVDKVRFKPLPQYVSKQGKLKISVADIHKFDFVAD